MRVVGGERRLHVYTPPGYEAGKGRFPVFYLLHGAFDCDDSWSTVGRAGFILDNLIAAKQAVPMVVVMPAGHTGPFRFGASFGRAATDGRGYPRVPWIAASRSLPARYGIFRLVYGSGRLGNKWSHCGKK